MLSSSSATSSSLATSSSSGAFCRAGRCGIELVDDLELDGGAVPDRRHSDLRVAVVGRDGGLARSAVVGLDERARGAGREVVVPRGEVVAPRQRSTRPAGYDDGDVVAVDVAGAGELDLEPVRAVADDRFCTLTEPTAKVLATLTRISSVRLSTVNWLTSLPSASVITVFVAPPVAVSSIRHVEPNSRGA